MEMVHVRRCSDFSWPKRDLATCVNVVFDSDLSLAIIYALSPYERKYIRSPPASFHAQQKEGPVMKARILLVGEDSVLLSTRAMLLAEWDPEIVSTNRALSLILAQPSVDVLIIGQLVPEMAAKRLIAEARKAEPAPAIVAIRFPEDEVELGVETYISNSWESPSWLRDCVARLIADRASI